MSLRIRIIIFTSAIVFVILSISLFLFIRGKQKNAPVATKQQQVIDTNNFDNANLPTNQQQPTETRGATVKPPTKAEEELRLVKEMGRTFVERFNTFSSENNYQNIRDVKNMVTANFWDEISAPLKKPQQAGEFYSVTVNVISLSNKVNGNYGTVLAGARKVTKKGTVETTSYANYTVSLIKNNGNWFVSAQSVK